MHCCYRSKYLRYGIVYAVIIQSMLVDSSERVPSAASAQECHKVHLDLDLFLPLVTRFIPDSWDLDKFASLAFRLRASGIPKTFRIDRSAVATVVVRRPGEGPGIGGDAHCSRAVAPEPSGASTQMSLPLTDNGLNQIVEGGELHSFVPHSNYCALTHIPTRLQDISPESFGFVIMKLTACSFTSASTQSECWVETSQPW